ncbi:hypothetical protein HanIR_Chr11g0551951 [Helianthus annuus]|nr:hypothetical protein HanIR_Chr11g0551951 [Helianthus annuus]
MEPIKSNHHPSQYSPLDHAEMKSQPFKLTKITAVVAVHGGLEQLLVVTWIPVFTPHVHVSFERLLVVTWVVLSVEESN